MPIKAVISDFGGVLMRTMDWSGRRKWEMRLGLPDRGLLEVVFDSEVARQASIGQADEADIWQHVASTFKLTDAQLEELQRDFWGGDQLDHELVRFLRDLRPRYKTAILSNAWPSARAVFIQTFGLDQAVDSMIISGEEGLAKPDARIYRLAAARLGVQVHEALFIDDVPENVQAAQALGMGGVLFQNTQQTITAVKAHLNGHTTPA